MRASVGPTHTVVGSKSTKDENSWRARLLRVMSPPVQRPGDRKRFWFSLFYTTTQVFALISSLVYWAVLVPTGHGYSLDPTRLPVGMLKLFDEARFQSFWALNLWGVTVLIVFVEVMFLNNVKRQVVSIPCVSPVKAEAQADMCASIAGQWSRPRSDCHAGSLSRLGSNREAGDGPQLVLLPRSGRRGQSLADCSVFRWVYRFGTAGYVKSSR